MLIKREKSERFQNSPDCTVHSYPFDEKDINVVFAEVKGRYPESGYVLNEEVKEVCYIVSGEGRVVIEDQEYEVFAGDMILVPPQKRYFMQGDINLTISCAPAWFAQQHKHFETLCSEEKGSCPLA